MRLKTERERCQGHARCVMAAPAFFTIDDNGYTALDDTITIDSDVAGAVRRGVEDCPEGVFTLEEAIPSDD